MWEHWNGILHDKDQSIILSALNNAIREEFMHGYNGLSREIQALFGQGCALNNAIREEFMHGYNGLSREIQALFGQGCA
jgi:hypothetical protein